MKKADFLESPIQEWPELGAIVGAELWIKRDDLLPFPLAGNKWRKLSAEALSANWRPGEALISNGGVNSNHCRTLAWLGAELGCRVHVVLHSEAPENSPKQISLRLLESLGATYDIVPSLAISEQLQISAKVLQRNHQIVHVVPGGAHTPAGAGAYRLAASRVLEEESFDCVVVASGTGATQAGLILGAHDSGTSRIVGVSVARTTAKGVSAIRECLTWFQKEHLAIEFYDRFVDGGYGRFSHLTESIVELAWKRGLPLDPIYTGKAFRGMKELIATGSIPAGRVLFWHTGGLMNYLG